MTLFKLVIAKETIDSEMPIPMMILMMRIKPMLTRYPNIRVSPSACVVGTRVLMIFGLSCGLLQSSSVLAGENQDKCLKTFNYSIYLSGLHTGKMTRIEKWQGKSAIITSKSEASILGIGTQYQQRSEVSWSNITNEWLTDNFHQQVSGFRSRDMHVTVANNGLESRVDLDGDITAYQSKSIPLRDVDTLAIQIREYLILGRQQFALVRQASDALEPYQYYVKSAVTATIPPWGEMQLIPVEQTGADEVTYFFAPSMNFQLVKAHYHGFILQGLIELDSYVSSCNIITKSAPLG
ncbi:hypothetical protein ABIS04_08875 [Shewanella sp. H8]